MTASSVRANTVKLGDGAVKGKDREDPNVTSHWGQRMAATFTKANSQE